MKSLHDVVTRWWAGELGGAGRALDVVTAPVELMFRGVTTVRNALYEGGALERTKLTVPVVSVGNLAVGGAGKTPVTAWLAGSLHAAGRRPAVLHGGYADDEPALHREMNPQVPVHAGRDRVATGRAAIAEGADILVLDDAFQHRRLARDLDIVLVAAESWHRGRRALPRGPWREDVSALARADWVIVTRRTATLEAARATAAAIRSAVASPRIGIVCLRARTWMHDGELAAPPPQAALAVAAIATPDAFVLNAHGAGAATKAVAFFPDHHEYSAMDAESILRAAGASPIITTAKDWVKLRRVLPASRVWVLEQSVEPEDDAEILLGEVLELGK